MITDQVLDQVQVKAEACQSSASMPFLEVFLPAFQYFFP